MIHVLTVVQSINASAQGDLISQNDTSVNSQQTGRQPPSDRVTNKVDLLAGVVLGPEADTTQQEWPLVRMAGIRMAAGQLAVVVEHGSLQFKPLAEERQRLDLAFRPLSAGVVSRQSGNVLNQPNVGAGRNLFVAVDFLLAGAPVRQGLAVRPHGNFAGVVNELEVTGNRLEFLVGLAILNSNLEQSIVDTTAKSVFQRNSGEFLVGWVERRSNIV